MISETSARRRTLIGLIACLAVAAFFSGQWVAWIYPSFTDGAYADFKFYPHGLFLPASVAAFVLQGSGDPDVVLRRALRIEAFLICFPVMFIMYLLLAAIFRRDNTGASETTGSSRLAHAKTRSQQHLPPGGSQ